MHQNEFIAHGFANLADFLHVPNVAWNLRSTAMLSLAGVNLVCSVSKLLGIQHIRYIVFNRRQVLRTRISHHALLCGSTSRQDFVDWPVDSLAKNIPHANIGCGSVVIRPRAASAREDSRPRGRTAVSRSRSLASSTRTKTPRPPRNRPVKTCASLHAGGRSKGR